VQAGAEEVDMASEYESWGRSGPAAATCLTPSVAPATPAIPGEASTAMRVPCRREPGAHGLGGRR